MAEARAQQPVEATYPGPRPLGRSTAGAALAWGFWLVVLANALVIVVLWWRGGNVTGVHTLGDLLTSIGRITGLLGAYFALIQVLLVARLPFLEHLTGFDRLTVWHRRNAYATLYLVLAHVVFITIGYALLDRLSLPAEVSSLLYNYPWMLSALIGTALMILVVVSSVVIVRRHLPYEAWFLVHLTIYLGLALAWFHQIPTGNELITNRTAADYWTALYLATLALLLLYRFARPLLRLHRHQMRVSGVTVEGPSVVSLRIAGRDLDRLGARGGQFFIWRFLTPNRWWEAHPFSLSEAPGSESLRITVKNVGDFTSKIGEITPGTAVVAEGPFGRFTQAVRRRERVALIAGGIGITPIRSLLEEMPGDLVLIYRVIAEQDLVFRDELTGLAAERGIRLCYVVGDHRAPGNERLLSTEHLRRLVPDIGEREVYLCGPPAMMDILQENVLRAGVPRKYLHVERFAL